MLDSVFSVLVESECLPVTERLMILLGRTASRSALTPAGCSIELVRLRAKRSA